MVVRTDRIAALEQRDGHLSALTFASGESLAREALFFATDPALHGVECAGPHARDLGREGEIPSVDSVIAATGELMLRKGKTWLTVAVGPAEVNQRDMNEARKLAEILAKKM